MTVHKNITLLPPIDTLFPSIRVCSAYLARAWVCVGLFEVDFSVESFRFAYHCSVYFRSLCVCMCVCVFLFVLNVPWHFSFNFFAFILWSIASISLFVVCVNNQQDPLYREYGIVTVYLSIYLYTLYVFAMCACVFVWASIAFCGDSKATDFMNCIWISHFICACEEDKTPN